MSLLPISSKSLYKFVEENSLLCSNQSECNKTDLCVNQLFSLVHETYKSFDNFLSLETRSEFLDMPKAFDRVWHEGLIYKLKAISCYDNLQIFSFLDNRY